MIAADGERHRARTQGILDGTGQSARPGRHGVEAASAGRLVWNDIAVVGDRMAEVGEGADEAGRAQGCRAHQGAGLAGPDLDRRADQPDTVPCGWACLAGHPVSTGRSDIRASPPL